MAKKLMRILGGYITHLSLCPAGANNISTVYKAKDGKDHEVSLEVLSKEMTEQGEIVSVVYVPEMVDKQNDLASAEVVKSLAYSFAQAGEGVDIVHNEKVLPKTAVYIAESFIIQKGDPRFDGFTTYEGKAIDVTGGWGVVVKVEDEKFRALYRSGEWKGISMGGIVHKRPESDGRVAAKTQPLNNGGESEMTAEEIKALTDGIAEANKALATSIVDGVTQAMKPTKKQASGEPTPEEKAKAEAKEKFMKSYPAPVLPVKPTEEHFAHMEKCIRVHELANTVDPTNVRSVFEFQKMAKAIMEGTEDESTLNLVSPVTDPWGFHTFKSNQAVTSSTNSSNNQVGPDIISLSAKSDDKLSDAEVAKMVGGIPGYGQVVPSVDQQNKQTA